MMVVCAWPTRNLKGKAFLLLYISKGTTGWTRFGRFGRTARSVLLRAAAARHALRLRFGCVLRHRFLSARTAAYHLHCVAYACLPYCRSLRRLRSARHALPFTLSLCSRAFFTLLSSFCCMARLPFPVCSFSRTHYVHFSCTHALLVRCWNTLLRALFLRLLLHCVYTRSYYIPLHCFLPARTLPHTAYRFACTACTIYHISIHLSTARAFIYQ